MKLWHVAALSDLLKGLHAPRPVRVLLKDLGKKLPQIMCSEPLSSASFVTSGSEASAMEIPELFHETGFKLLDHLGLLAYYLC